MYRNIAELIESTKPESKTQAKAQGCDLLALKFGMSGRARTPCEPRVRVFMRNLGMKFRKAGTVPAKADLDKQEDLKKRFRAGDSENKGRRIGLAFHGRCTFCTSGVPRLSVVFCKSFHSQSVGPKALECLRCLRCGHWSTDDCNQ